MTISGETRFYVQLPVDRYGNTSHGYVVIEARREPAHTPGREQLTVTAPADFAQTWPALDAARWAETEGPARKLTREEWEALVSQVQP